MNNLDKKKFSSSIQCGHCLNNAPMEVISEYSRVVGTYELYPNEYENVSRISKILKCPACNDITIQEHEWADFMDPEDVTEEIVYPKIQNGEIPLGLPANIDKGFSAAQKIKYIDANAFAVLIGRVLEMVCLDRKASGKNFAAQLQDLASRGEIPEKLVMVAKNLRDFRNIGAHATLGELTKDEVPILSDLCNAVLQYVYTAPYLAELAEKRVKQLKQNTKK